MDDEQRRAMGMARRRQVLGDAHVDRAIAATTPLTAEFQDLITRYAWGEIWTRPGLDLHSRRVLVVGTMIALGRWEELRMHARTALASVALTVDELKEIILQHAVYCGVPAANHALAELAGVVAEGAARG